MTTTTCPAGALIAELEQEAISTRRLLATVPAERLSWAPHERSFTLGQQAHHIAAIPGGMAARIQADTFDIADRSGDDQPDSVEAVLQTFDEGLASALETLGNLSEADLDASWKLLRDGECLMELPRAAAFRSFLFNHLYHHRGQLVVYLRLLDLPLPSVYGPSADEDPFAAT